jgi:hypothetical protein
VASRAQAVVLLDRRTARFLRPFMRCELSVSEAAAELDCTVGYLLQRVRRFERLGLLEVVGVRPRKGRPIKIYRATGSEFFVPLSVMEMTDFLLHERPLTELILRSMLELIEAFAAVVPEPGFRIEHTETQLRLRSATDDDNSLDLRADWVPPVLHEWRWPRLPREQAKALQVAILDLIEEAVAESDPAGEAYVINVRMTPVGQRVDPSVIES